MIFMIEFWENASILTSSEESSSKILFVKRKRVQPNNFHFIVNHRLTRRLSYNSNGNVLSYNLIHFVKRTILWSCLLVVEST